MMSSDFEHIKVAVLHQAAAPPLDASGTPKPMKPGGYKDSGADVVYCLLKNGVNVVQPDNQHDNPKDSKDIQVNQDTCTLPDTIDGINHALQMGANCLWANTVLFEGHPLELLVKEGKLENVKVVGQIPGQVQKYDDKWATNQYLRISGIRVAPSFLLGSKFQNADHQDSVDVTSSEVVISPEELSEEKIQELKMNFPLVIKPVRGRGSEGVVKVNDMAALQRESTQLLNATVSDPKTGKVLSRYGPRIIVENYLSGQEITITVMPPGKYTIEGQTKIMDDYWSLPVIKRFNHVNGIAPYNGVVAVVQNSSGLSEEERKANKYLDAMRQCEKAAKLVNAKAPIRVDCREDNEVFYLFDLNMKPNMTGSGRPGREDQDSLSTMAAREIGWNYSELLINILRQMWPSSQMLSSEFKSSR